MSSIMDMLGQNSNIITTLLSSGNSGNANWSDIIRQLLFNKYIDYPMRSNLPIYLNSWDMQQHMTGSVISQNLMGMAPMNPQGMRIAIEFMEKVMNFKNMVPSFIQNGQMTQLGQNVNSAMNKLLGMAGSITPDYAQMGSSINAIMGGGGAASYGYNPSIKLMNDLLSGTYINPAHTKLRSVFGGNDMVEFLMMGKNYGMFRENNNVAATTQNLADITFRSMQAFGIENKEQALRSLLEISGGEIDISNTGQLRQTLDRVKALSDSTGLAMDIIKQLLQTTTEVSKQLNLPTATGFNLGLQTIQTVRNLNYGLPALASGPLHSGAPEVVQQNAALAVNLSLASSSQGRIIGQYKGLMESLGIYSGSNVEKAIQNREHYNPENDYAAIKAKLAGQGWSEDKINTVLPSMLATTVPSTDTNLASTHFKDQWRIIARENNIKEMNEFLDEATSQDRKIAIWKDYKALFMDKSQKLYPNMTAIEREAALTYEAQTYIRKEELDKQKLIDREKSSKDYIKRVYGNLQRGSMGAPLYDALMASLGNNPFKVAVGIAGGEPDVLMAGTSLADTYQFSLDLESNPELKAKHEYTSAIMGGLLTDRTLINELSGVTNLDKLVEGAVDLSPEGIKELNRIKGPVSFIRALNELKLEANKANIGSIAKYLKDTKNSYVEELSGIFSNRPTVFTDKAAFDDKGWTYTEESPEVSFEKFPGVSKGLDYSKISGYEEFLKRYGYVRAGAANPKYFPNDSIYNEGEADKFYKEASEIAGDEKKWGNLLKKYPGLPTSILMEGAKRAFGEGSDKYKEKFFDIKKIEYLSKIAGFSSTQINTWKEKTFSALSDSIGMEFPEAKTYDELMTQMKKAGYDVTKYEDPMTKYKRYVAKMDETQAAYIAAKEREKITLASDYDTWISKQLTDTNSSIYTGAFIDEQVKAFSDKEYTAEDTDMLNKISTEYERLISANPLIEKTKGSGALFAQVYATVAKGKTSLQQMKKLSGKFFDGGRVNLAGNISQINKPSQMASDEEERLLDTIFDDLSTEEKLSILYSKGDEAKEQFFKTINKKSKSLSLLKGYIDRNADTGEDADKERLFELARYRSHQNKSIDLIKNATSFEEKISKLLDHLMGFPEKLIKLFNDVSKLASVAAEKWK